MDLVENSENFLDPMARQNSEIQILTQTETNTQKVMTLLDNNFGTVKKGRI